MILIVFVGEKFSVLVVVRYFDAIVGDVDLFVVFLLFGVFLDNVIGEIVDVFCISENLRFVGCW